MTTVTPQFSLVLSEEERTQLLSLLEQILRDTRVEAHRTDAPNYREWVEHRELLLQNVINRLRILSASSGTAGAEAR
jgi:hypothetical protein